MFRSRIGYYLPVVDTLIQLDIRVNCSKQIVILLKVQTSIILTHLDFFWKCGSIPCEPLYNNANDVSLHFKVFHFLLYIKSSGFRIGDADYSALLLFFPHLHLNPMAFLPLLLLQFLSFLLLLMEEFIYKCKYSGLIL
ncbi:hypothetical protein FGO68_gene8200 [Halteria grandinella]|uniref:Uncharacterized protein n=1 Tax=Halteria grandinella TaxID=5974 RepID=A0A8J8P224_HALGN|nr:hypothetical protein FGO68_gene8200 [Halteria grandinella]